MVFNHRNIFRNSFIVLYSTRSHCCLENLLQTNLNKFLKMFFYRIFDKQPTVNSIFYLFIFQCRLSGIFTTVSRLQVVVYNKKLFTEYYYILVFLKNHYSTSNSIEIFFKSLEFLQLGFMFLILTKLNLSEIQEDRESGVGWKNTKRDTGTDFRNKQIIRFLVSAFQW